MSVKVTKDKLAKLLGSIQELTGKQVLVGITAETAERDDGSPINNAQRGYIHEFGSPAANIPARAFLIPGIEMASDSIASHMQKALTAALSGNKQKVDSELNAAGLVGQAGARYQINNGAFAPLAPSTIRSRKNSRKTKSMRKEEKEYLRLVEGGSLPADAQTEADIKPLINTGELRNSITYVVRKKG